MKYRLRYYGLLMLVIFPAFMYLLLLFTYNWYLEDYQTPRQVVEDILSRNGRWIIWGACAGGFGFLLGLIAAIGLIIVNSPEEFFEEMSEGLPSIIKGDPLPSARGIGIFFILVIIFFLVISGDWRLGLRDGLEIIGVIVWIFFLVTTFIFMLTLLTDVFFRRLVDFMIDYKSEKDSQ